MDFALSEDQQTIRKAVAELAARFDDSYWMEKDRAHEFPTEFYDAFAEGGWLGITTPEEYGGSGFGITEASLLLEEVAASGAGMNGASSIHMSIFGMHPVIVHGSDEMKRENLPRIASGDLHVCFGVTEPEAGSTPPGSPRSPSGTARTTSSTARRCGSPRPWSRRRS